jgi:hypothetical protein
LESAPPADYEMGNWYISTYPGSLFHANRIVARPSQGPRATVFNPRLTIRDRDGSVARRVLAGIDDYREALIEHFCLSPTDDELVGITAAMASRSGDEEVPRAFSNRFAAFVPSIFPVARRTPSGHQRPKALDATSDRKGSNVHRSAARVGRSGVGAFPPLGAAETNG